MTPPLKSWQLGVLAWILLGFILMASDLIKVSLAGVIVFFGIPYALLFWGKHQGLQAWRRDFEQWIGPGARSHYEAGSGVAVNTSLKKIFLSIGGAGKAYPFEDVREWVVQSEKAGQIISVNHLSQTFGAAFANSRASKAAKENTGLFIRVRDTVAPEWRITMSNKVDRDRWFEILNQTINEGREVV